MCDVLDLSVRCPSSQLSPLDNNVVSWMMTPVTTVSLTPHVNDALKTSAPWTSNVEQSSRQYDLEPISPCSSGHSPLEHPLPPRSCLDRAQLAGICERRTSTFDTQNRLMTADRWSSNVPVTAGFTSHQQLSNAPPRRWNGDGGHPYSPLKRVLHQYRSGVAQDNEVALSASSDSRTPSPEKPFQSEVSQTVATPAATAAGSSRKLTTTTATSSGMTFEEFVLGMLSKVGGGKAITAATQSYLRESAAATAVPPTSNTGSNSSSEVQVPSADVVQKTSHFDQRMVPSPSVYQHGAENRPRQHGGLLASSMRDFSPSPYQYPASRPPSDIRLMPPHQPPHSLPPMMRRLPVRLDTGEVGGRDEAYRERRRKNNEAAKRSRDTRRLKELQVATQAERLADENLQLKAEIAVLRSQLGYLHRMMLDNNNGPHLNGSSSSNNSSINVNDTDPSRADNLHDNSERLYPPEDNVDRTV